MYNFFPNKIFGHPGNPKQSLRTGRRRPPKNGTPYHEAPCGTLKYWSNLLRALKLHPYKFLQLVQHNQVTQQLALTCYYTASCPFKT